MIIDYKYLKNIISSFDDTKLVFGIINVSRRRKTINMFIKMMTKKPYCASHDKM